MRSVFGKSYKIEVKERRWRRDGSTENDVTSGVGSKSYPKASPKSATRAFFFVAFQPFYISLLPH